MKCLHGLTDNELHRSALKGLRGNGIVLNRKSMLLHMTQRHEVHEITNAELDLKPGNEMKKTDSMLTEMKKRLAMVHADIPFGDANNPLVESVEEPCVEAEPIEGKVDVDSETEHQSEGIHERVGTGWSYR